MTRLLAITPVLAVLLMAPAWAQIGNPAGMAPGTPQSAPGVPAPHQPNQQDRLFVQEAAIGGMAEVEFGKMAEQKGQSSAIKDFGRRMVQEHTKANDRLAALAKAANIPLPGDLDPDHRTMRAELEKLSGAQFDWAYIQGQVQDHQRTAHLLEWEIGSGQDAELQKFASETLPVVFQHLQMAQSIAAQLTGGPPQAAAQPEANTGPSPQRPQPDGRGSGSRR